MAITTEQVYSMNHMCPVMANVAMGTAFKAAQDDIDTAEAAIASTKAANLVATTALGGEAGNVRILTVTLKDATGAALTAAVDFWLELISAADASFAFTDAGKGSVVYNNTSADKCLFKTDATGVAEVGIGTTAAETVIVAVGSGPGTPIITGTSVSCVFA